VRVLVFLVLSLPAATFGQTRASRCWQACERNVTEPRARASACGTCLTRPDEPAAWLARAPVPTEQLLLDPDWEVRWAGLVQDARANRTTAARQLARWVTRVDDERPCVTAAHAAGLAKQSVAQLLENEPLALRACIAREPAVIAALSTELYAESAGTRREALRHLARALARPPARVVLDALPAHPAAFDPLVLETLRDVAFEEDATAPGALLATATPADVEAMNRALAVFSAQRDQARAQRASTDPTQRKEALRQLAALAPLSEPELLEAVLEADAGLRGMAGRGLARGEQGSFAAMASRRLSGARPATLAQQEALLRLMGDLHETDCAAVALETWRERARPVSLRTLALPIAASCEWAAAQEEVERALRSEPDVDRPAAVAALAFAPASAQLFERLERASTATSPEVRAAACDSIGARRWRGGAARVTSLLADPVGAVRLAAARAAFSLETPGLELKLVHLLEGDDDAAVRSEAASLLGRLGGPRAVTALHQAARNDTNTGVKLVAAQSLRKLGAGSLSP
jgi:hypothetical protein